MSSAHPRHAGNGATARMQAVTIVGGIVPFREETRELSPVAAVHKCHPYPYRLLLVITSSLISLMIILGAIAIVQMQQEGSELARNYKARVYLEREIRVTQQAIVWHNRGARRRSRRTLWVMLRDGTQTP